MEKIPSDFVEATGKTVPAPEVKPSATVTTSGSDNQPQRYHARRCQTGAIDITSKFMDDRVLEDKAKSFESFDLIDHFDF